MTQEDMILKYMPSFCWQTREEILTMLEQVNGNINTESIFATIWLLHKKKLIISEKVSNGKQGARTLKYRKPD